MSENPILLYQLNNFFVDVAIFVVPPLVIATILGFFVALFQAITQIQDQSLSQTVKLLAIYLIIMLLGGGLIAPLIRSTETVFNNFHLWI